MVKISFEARLGIFFLIMLGLYVFLERSVITISAVHFVGSERLASTTEITHGDRSKNDIILTFDGGSGAESAGEILSVLRRRGLKSTFFLTGKFVEENPGLVRRMVTEGHEIFNHTYDHQHLTALSDPKIAQELKWMDLTLKFVAGTSTRPYFRPPYGDRDARVLKVAGREGFRSVYWSVDARDWEQSLGVTAYEVEERVLGSLQPGNIYLMHLGDSLTGKILDSLISQIEKRGYSVVSLTQGL